MTGIEVMKLKRGDSVYRILYNLLSVHSKISPNIGDDLACYLAVEYKVKDVLEVSWNIFGIDPESDVRLNSHKGKIFILEEQGNPRLSDDHFVVDEDDMSNFYHLDEKGLIRALKRKVWFSGALRANNWGCSNENGRSE